MSQSRSVLLVAYHFPPLGGIASLRALRFARLLPEFGWQPIVLTARRGDYTHDPSLTFPEAQVHRTGNLELSRAGREVLGLPAGAGARLTRRSPLAWLRRFARRWLYRPDAQIGWYPFALAAARRVLRDQPIEAVFTTAFPITAHLVGRRLRRDTGLPWVADFRDLWSDWAFEPGLRLRLDQALEHDLLAEASAVASTSDTYADVLRNRGARRSLTLTNAFDECVTPRTMRPRRVGPLHVAHLGSFYPEYQTLDAALLALGALQSTHQVTLTFVGALPAALAPVLARAGLEPHVEATGFVAHAKSLERAAQADVLLVAGPAHAETPAMRGLVPAKVFEYLGLRRPILMLGAPQADVARWLTNLPWARVVAPDDVAGARQALLELASLEPRATPLPAEYERFSARAVTRTLATLLDACVAQP